jgi:hypothetical protein
MADRQKPADPVRLQLLVVAAIFLASLGWYLMPKGIWTVRKVTFEEAGNYSAVDPATGQLAGAIMYEWRLVCSDGFRQITVNTSELTFFEVGARFRFAEPGEGGHKLADGPLLFRSTDRLRGTHEASLRFIAGVVALVEAVAR